MKSWWSASGYGFLAFILFSLIVGIVILFGAVIYRHPEIIPWLTGCICVWLVFTVFFKKGILR